MTPGWHSRSGKLIAIGTKLRYSQKGAQLLDKPRSHECAYATYDPKTQQWTKWKMLAMPETDGKFFLVAPGCVQWLVEDDGSMLIPIYFKGPTGSDYIATVLHCSFDGQELTTPGARQRTGYARRSRVLPSHRWHDIGKVFPHAATMMPPRLSRPAPMDCTSSRSRNGPSTTARILAATTRRHIGSCTAPDCF